MFMQFLGIIFILQVNFISANRLQSLYFLSEKFLTVSIPKTADLSHDFRPKC